MFFKKKKKKESEDKDDRIVVVKISVDTQSPTEGVSIPKGLVFMDAVHIVKENLEGKGGRIILTTQPDDNLMSVCASGVKDEAQISRPHNFRFVTGSNAKIKPIIDGVFTAGKVDFYCIFMKVD